eukprot:1142496-Pelagomonas_calceolata.AAC.2
MQHTHTNLLGFVRQAAHLSNPKGGGCSTCVRINDWLALMHLVSRTHPPTHAQPSSSSHALARTHTHTQTQPSAGTDALTCTCSHALNHAHTLICMTPPGPHAQQATCLDNALAQAVPLQPPSLEEHPLSPAALINSNLDAVVPVEDASCKQLRGIGGHHKARDAPAKLQACMGQSQKVQWGHSSYMTREKRR